MTTFSRLAMDGVLCLLFFRLFFSGLVFRDAWMEVLLYFLRENTANFRLLGPSSTLRTTCSSAIVADDSFTRHTSYLLSNLI
ncbi:hypothetical protein BJ165DRAFT_1493727, partial [Panaeolus papilionaceus]